MKPAVLKAFYRRARREFSPMTLADLRRKVSMSDAELRGNLANAVECGLMASNRVQDSSVRIWELTPEGEAHVIAIIRENVMRSAV